MKEIQLESADYIFDGPLSSDLAEAGLVAMLHRLHAFARTLRVRGYNVAWGKASQRGDGFLWVLSYQGVEGGHLLDVRIPSATSTVLRLRSRTAELGSDITNVTELNDALVGVLRDYAWRRFLDSARLLSGEE